jgi:hypothetical protein
MQLDTDALTLTITTAECYAAFVLALKKRQTGRMFRFACLYLAAAEKGQTANDPKYWLANVLAYAKPGDVQSLA